MVQNYCDEMNSSVYVKEGIAAVVTEDIVNVMIPSLNSSLITSTQTQQEFSIEVSGEPVDAGVLR